MKVVFLDKDGTLVEDVPYCADYTKIKFLPKTIEGLDLLLKNGYQLIVLTNQPAIGFGIFSANEFKLYMHYLTDALQQHNISILNWFACPHSPEEKCNCRKPNTGLLNLACKSYEIELSQSWMIGDILLDIEFAHRGGVQSVLLTNGYETEWDLKKFSIPKYCAPNLLGAAQIICNHEKSTT